MTQGLEPTIVAVSMDGSDAEISEFPVGEIDANLINDTNGAG